MFPYFNSNKTEMKEGSETMNYRREKWEKAFLVVSLGLFLTITSSLVLVTSISNFVLSYQTRNMLLEIVTGEIPDVPVVTREPSLPSSTNDELSETTSSEKPFSTNSLSSTTNVTTESVPTISTVSSTSTEIFLTTDEHFFTSTSLNVSTPHSSTDSSTEAVEKRNPVSVLNELNKKVKYSCKVSCSRPSIITARLNISLSVKSDNFLLLTIPVLTSDKPVAKARVAFRALELLYQDNLHTAAYNTTWDLPVPTNCTTPGKNTWVEKCTK